MSRAPVPVCWSPDHAHRARVAETALAGAPAPLVQLPLFISAPASRRPLLCTLGLLRKNEPSWPATNALVSMALSKTQRHRQCSCSVPTALVALRCFGVCVCPGPCVPLGQGAPHRDSVTSKNTGGCLSRCWPSGGLWWTL